MPGSVAIIDLAVVHANISLIRQRLPKGIRLLFVVKSDGYGHGLVPMAQVGVDSGVDYLGVVTVDEGIELRHRGIKLPILLLAPILPAEVERAVATDLTVSVSDWRVAAALAAAARRQGKQATVHVKVDTGMGRFGALPPAVPAIIAHLDHEPGLYVEGIFTQLSSAASTAPGAREYTVAQIDTFMSLIHALARDSLLPPIRHIANSAGFIQYPQQVTAAPLNMVRIGTLIYGYPEVAAAWTGNIRPAARLTAPVIATRTLEQGKFVGYGRNYQAADVRRVAVIAAGYGTGVPPRLAARGHVWIRGQLAPIVGAVYLDHTMIDVTAIDVVRVGDVAEIFGPHIPADRAAAWADLRVCELLVPALTQARRRVYR